MDPLELSLMVNPFTFGNPIRDPDRFVGRTQEIRQIVGRLLSSAHESTSLVGERRMGKTSLLRYLATPEIAADLGLSPDRYCVVYIDFQGLTDITPTRFWHRVLGRMAKSSRDPGIRPAIEAVQELDSFDLFDLEDLFEKLDERQRHVVLFLDEFEYVTQNPNFGADFFGGLRALAIHHNLALVPATRRELIDLCHSEEIKGSPFFNIFANVVLRPFTPQEVDELLARYLAASPHTFTVEERDLVASLGGGNPHFVQMAGYCMVEAKSQGLEGEALLARLAADFDQQADPHHRYLWSHSSDSEKITLLAVLALSQQETPSGRPPTLASLTEVHARAQVDVPHLLRRGLLIQFDDHCSLFSPSLGRWLAHELAASDDDAEDAASVEAWLKSGGREAVAPVRGALPRFKKKYWPYLAELLKELSVEVLVKAMSALATGQLL
jgi:hypothetical protein